MAMSTTTIRLSDDLKGRIASAAELAGLTPHAFMLEAVTEKTIKAEQQAEFLALADERYEKILNDGQVLNWDDVRSYLRARVQGIAEPAPKVYKK